MRLPLKKPANLVGTDFDRDVMKTQLSFHGDAARLGKITPKSRACNRLFSQNRMRSIARAECLSLAPGNLVPVMNV